MQTKDDGTHVILSVADALAASSDHARVPVMMLRQSDGSMRRGAQGLQPSRPINASLSAEDCTAHGDSQLSWHSVLLRREEWRSVAKRRDDDGEEEQDYRTD